MHAHIINIHMECGYRVQSLIMLCSILTSILIHKRHAYTVAQGRPVLLLA